MASVLFTVGGAVVNDWLLAALAFNLVFSRLTDHRAEERERHDLTEEKF